MSGGLPAGGVRRLRPGRSAVQFPDHHPPGQPERHRPDADHLRRRRGQLLRRHPELHGRRRGPDLRGRHQRRVPGLHPLRHGLRRSGPAAAELWLHGVSGHRAGRGAPAVPQPDPDGSESAVCRRESRHGGCGGHQRLPQQVPGHLRGRRYLRSRRPVLHHGLHQGHLGQRRHHRVPGLAGRGAGDLRHLADSQRHLGLLPVRPAVLGVPHHPRPGPAGHVPLQHAAVSRDHRGADLRLPGKKEGDPPPRRRGSGVFRGGTVAPPQANQERRGQKPRRSFCLFTSPPGGSGLR